MGRPSLCGPPPRRETWQWMIILVLVVLSVENLLLYLSLHPTPTQGDSVSDFYEIPVREGVILYFSNSSLKAFNNLYSSRDDEYVACIYGFMRDGNIYVSNYSIPDVYNQSSKKVTYNLYSCNASIGTIHSHIPQDEEYNYCIPSLTDIYAWGLLQRRG